MCRGVTRLDDAWGKKQVWRPHVRTWGLSEANVQYWWKCLWHCDFLVPRSDSEPGELCPPCPLLLRLWWCAVKIGKIPKIINVSVPNVMTFYSVNICNFRTQYGMGLAQTSNKGYWRHFGLLRVFFVSCLCLPHAFLRRGPVFVLLIIKPFRNWTSYFLKAR